MTSQMRKPATLAGLALWALSGCVGGGSGPSETPEHDQVTLVTGDIVLAFPATGELLRGELSCDDTSCTASLAGDTLTVELTDLTEDDIEDAAVSGVRQRNGVSIGRVNATEDGVTVSSYGVWGEHGGGSASLMTGSFLGVDFRAIVPFSVGYETGSNPVSGTASWSGAMAGVRVDGNTIGEEVTGDADMTADLAAVTVDLTLSAIGAPSGATVPDIAWQDVPMRGGAFSASGLQGRFYGPGHAEAGGVFRRQGIEGAFSLARD